MESRGLGSAAEVLARLPQDPSLYPQKLDLVRQAVLVVGLDEGAYRQQSFLDDRLIQGDTRGSWVPLAPFLEFASQGGAASPEHFIFHVGHCGSTLLSRLLGELDWVLPLREPLPLRTLASEDLKRPHGHWLLGPERFDAVFQAFRSVWARRFRPDQKVVLKATSSCNDLAGRLLSGTDTPASGLALTIPPQDYVATMLKNEAGIGDVLGFAEIRLERLHRELGGAPWSLHALSLGEIAVMGWATEVLALQRASQDGAMLWLDFESLLDAPGETLDGIAGHFGWSLDDRARAKILDSEAFGYYAKAPAHRFDPAARRIQLDESARRNAGEIRRAMDWLEQAAERMPALAASPPLS